MSSRSSMDYSSLTGFPAELARLALAGKTFEPRSDGFMFADFAGGCFWGLELAYQRVPGVIDTSVGYTQGHVEQPDYRSVCSGRTGHTEAVRVVYDPSQVSYQHLVEVLMDKIDPTQENGQGGDIGTQYRTGIYTFTDEQREVAAQVLAKEAKRFRRPIATELRDAKVFWPAEEYHQKYLERGGRYGMAQSARKGETAPIRCYEFREQVRRGEFAGVTTSGVCPGHAQANLCILPKEYAFDFLLFCQRNVKPCPLLEVLEPGVPMVTRTCSSTPSDVRTDVPKYRIWRDGKLVEEVTDITPYWQDDFVTFVIGCSFSFEEALTRAGLFVRHIEEGRNVPMYRTNIACDSAGMFSSEMVVSMRPYKAKDVVKAVEITGRYPRVHGAPVHIGSPEQIGITNIHAPDFGDAVTIHDDEVPVFWACGVTPQAAVMKSKPSICITHAPGQMLVLDSLNDDFMA